MEIETSVQSQQSVESREQIFSMIFNTTPLCMSISERETGKLIEVNDLFVETTGYPKSELIGRTTIELGLTSKQARQSLIDALHKNPKVEQKNVESRKKDGSTAYAFYRCSLITIDGKECILSAIEDTTEQKMTEDALKTSEKKFESAFKNSPLCMCISELETGKLIEVNQAYLDETGYTRSELIGNSSIELGIIRKEDRDSGFVEVTTKGSIQIELPLYRKDGSSLIAKIHSDQIVIGTGRFLLTIFENITEKKVLEESLKKSEEKFAAAFHLSPLLMSISDIETGKLFEVNQAFMDVTGYSESEMIGKTTIELGIIDQEKRADVSAILNDNGSVNTTLTAYRKDGSSWCADYHSERITIGDKEYLLSVAEDITEKKSLEASLKNSEQQFFAAFQFNPLVMIISEIESGKIIDANESFILESGYSREEWYGKTTLELNLISVQNRGEMARQLMQRGRADIEMITSIRKNGSKATMKLTSTIIPIGSEKYILSVLENITPKLEAEKTIRESEQKYRMLMDNLTTGVVVHNCDTTIVFSNPIASTLLGLTEEQMLGKTAIDSSWCFLTEEMKPIQFEEYPVNRVLATKQPFSDLILGISIPHQVHPTWVLCSGYPVFDDENEMIQVVITFHDITVIHESEAALHTVQKLEALGILAGGIAHDFNNLMGGVFGYIDLARMKSNDPTISSYLSEAMTAMERAQGLTSQLLTFAKGGAPIQSVMSLFPFVQETALFALSGSTVSCQFDIEQDLYHCSIDKNQIGQVIDNLVINAQQAMPLGGTIHLIARNHELCAGEHSTLCEGKYVKILIRDQGIGISKELLPRIFDPFFTTKEKCHGLGLATTYSIIHRHGGIIDVTSQIGEGTTFTIWLPAAEVISSSSKESVQEHRGTGTILIMDDEKYICNVTQKMLESFGYSVVCTHDGLDALDLFEEIPNLTACIFDLTVPGGLGGVATIEELRKTNETLPVFVASGYADHPVMENPKSYGFTASICKPFRTSELQELLENNLN